MMSNKVEEIQEESHRIRTNRNHNFDWIEWSLKPLIICFWFFGFPLRLHLFDSLSRRIYYFLIRIIGFLFFFVNFAVCSVNFYLLVTVEKRKGTLGWNDTISSLNFCFGLILAHFVLLTSVTCIWNHELLDLFYRIQNLFPFGSNASATNKLRRISLTSSVLIIIVSFMLLT